jgi:hypothetical protein
MTVENSLTNQGITEMPKIERGIEIRQPNSEQGMCSNKKRKTDG